ncbi:tRNA-uridine aminocarboxypropyltransferase [Polaribacter undariae]|uniref:tRNA-uridine aminocarboxypropyltransferase n=2 Tax=Polaribacter sejongensis TaxID=985043 RepID=A0AAJ1QXW6_9FLAO|nr:tRNA-uridine aminocarboxypropyltransferase [Polaribacter undariae]MDN3620140.1 tRNA-uridine aminocarboxypropyltransferase [Polaribacter undariae]UWD32542.1 DTW domain-containing protein [Polaribacter undariae]
MPVEIKETRIKCYKCMRSSSTCICKYISTLHTQTRFVILMHPKEYKKEKKGTGYMTNLQLENSEIIVGVDFTNNKRINEILAKENSTFFLLYPGKESFNLSTSNNTETQTVIGTNAHIFILDGTWPCARKMLKLSTNLQALKRVSFDNQIKSKFIIKQQPDPLCLSTIESVYTVLNLLKEAGLEQCGTKNFLIPFEKMIEYQLEYMLDPTNKNYCTTENSVDNTKNLYKKTTERRIIFE